MTADHRPTALRISIAVAATAATVTLAVTPTGVAQAQGGDPRVLVHNTPADIPADVCGFPIHIDVIDDREYWVQQTDSPDGSTTMRVTGTLKNRLTNLNTGASIDYDNGGPGMFTMYLDGHVIFDCQGHSMALDQGGASSATGPTRIQADQRRPRTGHRGRGRRHPRALHERRGPRRLRPALLAEPRVWPAMFVCTPPVDWELPVWAPHNPAGCLVVPTARAAR